MAFKDKLRKIFYFFNPKCPLKEIRTILPTALKIRLCELRPFSSEAGYTRCNCELRSGGPVFPEHSLCWRHFAGHLDDRHE